jgi:hypothetical protein
MPNSINSLSPSFRDYLLLKNLVTDTVVDNGLQALLNTIGYPAPIETLPNAVQASSNLEEIGVIFQQSNTGLNQYQGGPDDYTQVQIVLNQSNNSVIGNQGLYSNTNQLLNGQFYYNGNLTNSQSIRQSLTSKNLYVDVPKQTVVNLNTQVVPSFQNLGSYLDENNNLNVGGPSTQAADILGSLINGQGVGLSFGGSNGGVNLIPNEDIRATLLGRVLGATGVINDTPLGNIGGQQLLAHVGYNAAFGLQQETLGSLNLNPLTLLQGKPLVSLNYDITVPKNYNKLGRIVDFAAKIFGVQSPTSLLESSIFSFDNKGNYIGTDNITMGNDMIKNTGKGQVQSLFNNLRANTYVSNPNGTNLRQGYAPGYNDDRIDGNTSDGLNAQLYARDSGTGVIKDFMNGETNSPIASGNYERSKQISDDGWDINYINNIEISKKGVTYYDAFGWEDSKFNKDSKVGSGTNEGVSTTLFLGLGGDNKNRFKTLLSKTERLFNSGNMRTLVTGHGIKQDEPSQINSAVSRVGNYTSKGSGVMSADAIVRGIDDGPENVFCRTWTTYDRYAQVRDLQKNRGLYGDDLSPNYRRNTEKSVLDDNGFVKIAPYKNKKGELINEDNKRYMFSIENLAWHDELHNLLECEKGPGDLTSGKKGRIMWFPPYEINFSESTNASWDKHNFIGRGEPLYTYNNTERSGNLSWKIIIDHPNYLNFIGKAADSANGGTFDDYVASFFAGCTDIQQVNNLTDGEKDKIEVEEAKEIPVEVLESEVAPPSFNVYFPNDVYDVNKYPDYEDGLQNPGNEPILYKTNPTGENFGIKTYNEMCYQFKVGNTKTWSSVQCSKTPNVKQGDNGRIEPDRTDFGLNATGNTEEFKGTRLGDKKYKSWRDPEYAEDLKNYLLTKCKHCRVEVVGFASTVGTFGDNRNDELSKLRALNVKEWLEKNILTDPPFIDRVSIVAKGKGSTENGGVCPKSPSSRTKNYLKSTNDVLGCKINRYVTVNFVVDPELKAKEKPKVEEIKTEPNNKKVNIPISRYYSECDYFEKLELESPTAYNSIKDKIKYFQPAFHSTTPEGFNARLNFLQQCMRQGPTTGAVDNNNPNNLAFGRPPVCILRIGDFYHTKIIIENLNFSFEPLVWDLNPEGVGVQPMICNVEMSFAFIGGSSLNGPINRLQNAVSFNYFANTEIYDPRADTLVDKGGGVVEIKNGENDISGTKANSIVDSNKQTGNSPNPEPVKDQVKENDVANSGDDAQPVTPAETPVEKVKKYPGFDETTGIYTTQNAQILKYSGDEDNKIISQKIVVPKGTKFYLGNKTKNFSLDGNYIIGDKGINPNKYKIETTLTNVLPSNMPITYFPAAKKEKISLADKIYYNQIVFSCNSYIYLENSLAVNEGESSVDILGDSYVPLYQYNNVPLEKVLTNIFCKAGKVKTLKEVKQFDNTK